MGPLAAGGKKMSVPLPNLDDRQFDDLLKEVRSYIHRYCPRWTNHNLADPGITLLEMLTWLTDMMLYRLNRIPDRHYQDFLLLAGNMQQPAQAEQAPVVFELNEPLDRAVTIPRGTGLTADSTVPGQTIPFRTAASIKIPAGQTTGKGFAINVYHIRDEKLGKSNGREFQFFTLASSPVYLFDPADVDNDLADFNPKVSVNGEPWKLKPNLLNSTPGEKHFAVNAVTGEIRFGNNQFGAVPPVGAEIVCETYHRAGGAIGNVDSGRINHIRDTIPGAGSNQITVYNPGPAVGGRDLEPLTGAFARTVRELEKPYRTVSASDFETLAREADPGQVARVKCLPNRNLETSTKNQTGHVSVIIIPSNPDGEGKYIPGDDLKSKVYDYLYPRRLLTTRLHVVGPKYLEIGINFNVTAKSNVNPDQLEQNIRHRLGEFLHPLTGGGDGDGWPFGRDIFISEIYKVIGDVPGVDYIESAALEPGEDRVSLEENELPMCREGRLRGKIKK